MDKKRENDIMMVEIDVDKLVKESKDGGWRDGNWCGNVCLGIMCQI
ncbi:hypothetical protein SAMN02745248_00922 [Hathewaya proteolytica DSM 3090]|uniref:Uncharacterized protein n=1 Tax=Hathewaya proteolytica DSM 3090 TaxID=1121331 RepID=A0A1M6M349_9CLOT|nr:hypothetical protein [Hathewaya proteolytica]SHJ77753.1 hypothetical protein SAMN02745248_00922 [Hathewaya proteolytica DSM 3090]